MTTLRVWVRHSVPFQVDETRELRIRGAGRVGFVLARYFTVDVGPEFLGHIAEGVQHDVSAPDTDRVAECALVWWMVRVRDAAATALPAISE